MVAFSGSSQGAIGRRKERRRCREILAKPRDEVVSLAAIWAYQDYQEGLVKSAFNWRLRCPGKGDQHLLKWVDPQAYLTRRDGYLHAVIHGVESLAWAKGLTDSGMVSMTLNSQWHSGWRAWGRPEWNGASPRLAHLELVRVWDAVRKALERAGIEFVCFRVCEPHQDGTPHWHWLFFVSAGKWAEFESVFRQHYPAEDLWHEKKRLRFERTLYSKAVTSYIAKYIRKNTKGGLQYEGHKLAACWRWIWGIRAFAFSRGLRSGCYNFLRLRAVTEDVIGPAAALARANDLFGAAVALDAVGVRPWYRQAVSCHGSHYKRPGGLVEPASGLVWFKEIWQRLPLVDLPGGLMSPIELWELEPEPEISEQAEHPWLTPRDTG